MIKNSCIALFSLFVTALACEGLVRLLELSPKVYRLAPKSEDSAFQLSQNPILGYELKPNFRSEEPNYHRTFPLINSHGQRDIERSIEKPSGVTRIALLGDSVVAGHGLKKMEHLLHSTIGNELGDSFEVLNFGIGGYCTYSEVELLRERVLKFEPDIVVVVFVENDYVNQNDTILSSLTDSSLPQRSKIVEGLFLSSDVFRLVSLRTNAFGFRDEFTDHTKKHKDSLGENNVQTGFRLLAKLQKEHDFDLMIPLWPSFSDRQIHYSDEEGNPVLNGELPVERFAEESGLKTIRMDTAFNNNFNSLPPRKAGSRVATPKWMYTIGDGTHPSIYGSKIGAKVIAKHLLNSSTK